MFINMLVINDFQVDVKEFKHTSILSKLWYV